MKSLLESGVHFGHQTRRWNPKMKKYIFIKKNDIHIIDLKQTLEAINQAYYFFRELAAKGKRILFVGTKKQTSDGIENAAQKCGEFYISHRWYGGTLTNLNTIRNNISNLDQFEQLQDSGEIEKFTKLEILKMQRKYDKIMNALGGIREMDTPPDALFIADILTEKYAVKEAQNLKIPIVAMVDTNCNPDGIDYVIPANDDAMKSVNLISETMADAIIEGKKIASEGGDIDSILKAENEIPEKSEKDKAPEENEIFEEVEASKEEEISEEKKVEPEEIEKESKLKKEKKKVKKSKTTEKDEKESSETEEEETYICEECNKEFKSKRGLKIHRGLVHNK